MKPQLLLRGSAASLLAALLLSACSSNDEPPPLDVDALAQNTTAYQAAILSDGTVDSDEYEQAVFAAHSCVLDEGFSPNTPEWIRGELQFSVEMTAETEAELMEMNARYDEAYESCMGEYVHDVATVWAHQLLLSDDERDALRPDIINCLTSNGIELDDDASDEDIFAAMTAESISKWEPCRESYPAYFLGPADSD